MKIKSTLLLLLVFFLAVNSCKEIEEPDIPPVTEDPVDDPDTPGSETLPTSPINITFPEGTSVNLDDSKVLSGLFEFEVNSSGTSKSYTPSDEYVMAYLLDKEGKAMLMGFLGKGRTEISVKSTAEALIYFGAGLFTLPEEMKDKYFREAASIPEIEELIGQMETTIKQNPLALQQGLLNESWKSALEKIYEDGEIVDIRARVINVDASVKSGIQVFEHDIQNIKVRNNYKRRTHAFLYKQSFKDREKKETVLIKNSEFNGGLKAQTELPVAAVSSLDGVLGSARNVVMLNGGKYFELISDPMPTPLETNEIQAVYTVRVVGPGGTPSAFSMTDAEEEKVYKLTLEYTLLDIILPGIAQAIGIVNEIKESELKELYSFVEARAKNIPKLYEFSKNGDPIAFAKELLSLIQEDLMDKGFEKILVEIAKKGYESKAGVKLGNNADITAEFESKVKKAAKLLKIADLMVFAINSGIILNDVRKSTQMESFKVEVNDIPFKLEPKDAAVSVNEQKELTITKLGQLPNNQTYWIKWWTTGKYGVMRDKEGRAGKEIETNFTKMFYRAISNPSQIDEEAQDKVYAEVFIKEGEKLTSIGLDSITVKVKPIKLEIKPNGVTLSPINGGTSEIKLYVETAGPAKKLENNEEYEYRYEWGTKGDYGLFDGYSVTENTNENVVRYVALDEEVEKAEEEIFVRVYRLEKGTTEEKFYGEATGKVKIENDENWKIFHEPLEVIKAYNLLAENSAVLILAIIFEEEEEDLEYFVRFYGFARTAVPSIEGVSYSWKADQDPPKSADLKWYFAETKFRGEHLFAERIPDGKIALKVPLNGGLVSGTWIDYLEETFHSFKGHAEVRIRKKPKD
ncbi:hypothetical protein [Aquiflexum lacus]|uniref:hypothetical protein n=1 Tax=Aquiflexum lacus TaxID=2483805 RepID=UPI001892F52E|nr:hypothetical protein [Aquiflexum lacus]